MHRKSIVPFLTALLGLLLGTTTGAPVLGATEKSVRKKMGSRFEITAVHPDSALATAAIEAAYDEIDRLERLISSWDPASQTSRINDAAGHEAVAVDADLFGLIRRALKVSELTDGAFDISFAPVGALWKPRAENPRLPDPAEVQAALERVGWRHIEVDPAGRTVRLAREGMRIGFGGIGKGFAANRAARVLREHGIQAGVVNAGGDLLAFGAPENGRPWTVGIADPKRPDEVFAHLDVTNQAVVTSGDYESFVVIDGKRYSHIVDPRDGRPVDELVSVTILCPDAELADALATAVSVLGADEGMALIDRLARVEGLAVTLDGEFLFSRNLRNSWTQAGGAVKASTP